MSSFSGYENEETSTYLGTQCHGVMWPETASLPAAWPICPPIVSGKASCTAHFYTFAFWSLKPHLHGQLADLRPAQPAFLSFDQPLIESLGTIYLAPCCMQHVAPYRVMGQYTWIII